MLPSAPLALLQKRPLLLLWDSEGRRQVLVSDVTLRKRLQT